MSLIACGSSKAPVSNDLVITYQYEIVRAFAGKQSCTQVLRKRIEVQLRTCTMSRVCRVLKILLVS